MDELLRPILAITLVLMSVFLPASILPGIVGQLYRQFALVIAATALSRDLTLVTRNTKDFQSSSALLLDPWHAR